MENSMEFPKKTKNRATVWFISSNPRCISEKKTKTLIQKDTCTPMFILLLFSCQVVSDSLWLRMMHVHGNIICFPWQGMEAIQVSISRWIDKEDMYIYTCIYKHMYIYTSTHNGILPNQKKKRMKFCHLQQHGWTWHVSHLVKKSENNK